MMWGLEVCSFTQEIDTQFEICIRKLHHIIETIVLLAAFTAMVLSAGCTATLPAAAYLTSNKEVEVTRPTLDQIERGAQATVVLLDDSVLRGPICVRDPLTDTFQIAVNQDLCVPDALRTVPVDSVRTVSWRELHGGNTGPAILIGAAIDYLLIRHSFSHIGGS